MKIIFLGTNGWYTSPTGNTPSVLVDSQEGYIVFDAGNGIYKLGQYINEDKPIFLFISHFHIDHTSGLHSAATQSNFSSRIKLFIGPGRKKDYDIFVSPPFTSPKSITVKELKEGKNNVGFPVEVFQMKHTHTDHGFRIRLEGKIIAYSGDTGICNNSKPLAEDADLLIHECSYKADHAPDTWGHVGPIEAANLAKEAKAKKLILNHFDASLYTSLEDRKQAEKAAQEIFPDTTAAFDNLEIMI